GFIGAAIIMVALTICAELLTTEVDYRGLYALTLVAIAAITTGFITWWLRTPGRLFDVTVLSIQSFRVGNASGSIYRLVITAVPFMFTLLFQLSFGWSATMRSEEHTSELQSRF